MNQQQWEMSDISFFSAEQRNPPTPLVWLLLNSNARGFARNELETAGGNVTAAVA